MKRAIIDRFEGNFAICEMEDGSFQDIDIHTLPEDVAEGDIITICGDYIEVATEATQCRQEHIRDIMKDMWDE